MHTFLLPSCSTRVRAAELRACLWASCSGTSHVVADCCTSLTSTAAPLTRPAYCPARSAQPSCAASEPQTFPNGDASPLAQPPPLALLSPSDPLFSSALSCPISSSNPLPPFCHKRTVAQLRCECLASPSASPSRPSTSCCASRASPLRRSHTACLCSLQPPPHQSVVRSSLAQSQLCASRPPRASLSRFSSSVDASPGLPRSSPTKTPTFSPFLKSRAA